MNLSLFSFRIFLCLMLPFSKAFGLVGMEELSKNLFEKNQEIMALMKNVEAKEAQLAASKSGNYPTINAVLGYEQNKTGDLVSPEKGQVGYIEGKFNLFRGFKDQSIAVQRDLDIQIAKLELEAKKRELRVELTEIASQMVFLHNLQKVIDEELKVTQIHKQMASKKVSAGLTSTVDNLEFELREREIQIEQRQINQQHEEAHQRFIKLYGDDVADTGIARLEFSLISEIENFIKTITTFNVEESIEYQKSKLTEMRLEQEKREIKSDYLPSIDLNYSHGRLTPTEDANAKYNEYKYALQLTVPIFSGFDTQHKTKAAYLSMQAAENYRKQTKYTSEAEFKTLKIKISEMNELFQINEKKTETSQSYFDMTLAEYRRGVKNSPDLVGATERLFSAKKKRFEILRELETLRVKVENFVIVSSR